MEKQAGSMLRFVVLRRAILTPAEIYPKGECLRGVDNLLHLNAYALQRICDRSLGFLGGGRYLSATTLASILSGLFLCWPASALFT